MILSKGWRISVRPTQKARLSILTRETDILCGKACKTVCRFQSRPPVGGRLSTNSWHVMRGTQLLRLLVVLRGIFRRGGSGLASAMLWEECYHRVINATGVAKVLRVVSYRALVHCKLCPDGYFFSQIV